MDRLPHKATVTTTDRTTFSDLNRGRPRDPWRMMSELLAADRVATKKSIERPVQVASFDC